MPSENHIGFMQGSSQPLWTAAALLLASCALFLTLDAGGNWDFVLPLRLGKLAALLTVAYAVGVSTMLFQTLTNNPILTPSILGFDSLYIFLQTLLVFVLGGAGYSQLPPAGKFGFELVAMMGSLSSLLQRMIDPEEFAIAQAYTFASFNTVNQKLLGIGAAVIAASVFFVWRERHRLDVYMLGRDQTVNLGINYTRNTLWILLWIAALTATSTAVVGPVSFFGLLVAALPNHLAPSMRLPLAFCTAGILLVGGQTLFEHLLGMKAVLSVVVEFAGGLVFLYLILRKRK